MRARGYFVLLAGLSGLSGCSNGSNGMVEGSGVFELNGLSLSDGSVWPVNRPIEFSFNEPVDFSTVSSNTIRIGSDANVPALGVFSLRDPRTVVFLPNCPTREDLSDAGLQPGGVTYSLRVVGRDSSANTVRSLSGRALHTQQTRTFTTPNSFAPSVAFQDTRSGPPQTIRRSSGSSETNATRLEIGGDPDRRVYIELDEAGELVLSEPDFLAPLNLYSDPASRIAFLLAFDQAVTPSAANVSPNRLWLEYREPSGAWRRIETRVELVSNCVDPESGGPGASVRLEPVGILPPASALRAVVSAGFQDLVGEAIQQTQRAFAQVPTGTTAFTSLTPADRLADELNEPFEQGPASPLSRADADALFDSPQAEWGDGRLAAAFSFEGSGGPEGEFDWVVRTGQLFFFDTNLATLDGGPGGVPTHRVTAVDGVVDVRNLTIESGGEVRVQGPNPMRIRATGEVRIDGRLNLSGFNAKNVISITTGNLTEVGGTGVAGGGKGGSSNLNTSGTSLRGGRGDGPLGQVNTGGEGGETAVARDPEERRPGGGGGGRFARDWLGTTTVRNLSLAATAGTDGHPAGRGADPFDGHRPAHGGRAGTGPFLDASDENDFFGVKPVLKDGRLTNLLRGELPGLWAGYGGGGGGNAARTFPNPSWNAASDQKGGGGGGSAGGLHIQALGSIVFGPGGEILANGGSGGTGENFGFMNPLLGGTGGAGSGGHVVLETATRVDFTGNGTATNIPRDAIVAAGPRESTHNIYSRGGAGGSGVIQIHVPNVLDGPGASPPADILVPAAALAAEDVLDQLTSPPPHVLIPTFGKRSQARSKWISIGAADQKPDGGPAPVRFFFEGLDSQTGRVQTEGSTVRALPPLVAEVDLAASSNARILSDGFTLELTGEALERLASGDTSGLSNDLYLRTPSLLEDGLVRMRIQDRPGFLQDFPIASARYEEGAPAGGDERLLVTVVTAEGPLSAFNADGREGTTGFELRPRFFDVVTDGLSGNLPPTTSLRLRFQAAADNGIGRPNEEAPLIDWTSDISEFNALPPGALKFFRFEVEFDLDMMDQGLGADTRAVSLDFLKIPFVF